MKSLPREDKKRDWVEVEVEVEVEEKCHMHVEKWLCSVHMEK